MSEIISTRGRSVVTRGDGVVHKRYRRADPRNDVERAAYRHLAGYTAPTPRLVEITDDGIVLEAVANVGDYEAALGGDHALDASRALGRAYAELHEVPPAGAPTPQRLEVEHLHAWCDAMDVTRPDLGWAVAAYDDPGPMLAFSHGDPAPSNTLLRAEGGVVLLDFEYAGARHRGYDLAAWHVLCPLEPGLLDALHDGYGRAIDGFDALIVWRAVQVVAMNRTELLHADREFRAGLVRARVAAHRTPPRRRTRTGTAPPPRRARRAPLARVGGPAADLGLIHGPKPTGVSVVAQALGMDGSALTDVQFSSGSMKSPLSRPMSDGVGCASSSDEEIPSCPATLLPQQYRTFFAARCEGEIAQLCALPALT